MRITARREFGRSIRELLSLLRIGKTAGVQPRPFLKKRRQLPLLTLRYPYCSYQ